MPPFTLYLVHHSHCDLGYTHDLPVVYELQRRYIDQALDLADQHAGLGEEATFRWTCEVTSVVEHWLETASPQQVARFVAAAARGQIEVCALWCNLTPLATMAQHVEMLAPLRRLREELGLSIRAAMNSDVNGFSWGLAGLLAASGIRGLTMSINEHFGGAPQPFPGLFRWRMPQGNLLPVWSGPTYAHTAWLGMGGAQEKAFQNLKAMLAWREKRNLAPASWLAMQITHPGPQNDNMGPIAHLSGWVSRFNQNFGDQIRLVISTPGRLFDQIASDAATAEIREGEWNDWWNFGCGSTPFETSLFRQATARLEEADLLALVDRPRNFASLRQRACHATSHYIEHTWGADCSVNQPEEIDSRVQVRHKEKFAYDAFSLSRLLRRDGLSGLAARIQAPAGPALMVFNPSPYPRCEMVRVPRRFLAAENLPPTEEANASRRWPADLAYQHFVDRELVGGLPLEEIGPFQLLGFGWTVATPDRLAEKASSLVVSEASVTNGRITLAWEAGRFGLSRLTALGREWADGPLFGTVVAEEVLGQRTELMSFDDSELPARTRISVWNDKPPIRQTLPAETACTVTPGSRYVDVVQTGQLPLTDGVGIRWRIFADHDDVEVELTLRQLPDARAHSYYLALPFRVPEPHRLVSSAGLFVNPDVEKIPNGCRWWSAQEGYAVGDETAAAYVATPDAPMVGFERFPFGRNLDLPEGPGVSWVWVSNNYWETNFKADASGVLRYRCRLSFAPGKPRAVELARLGSHVRHGLAYHPLPENGGVTPLLQANGALLEFESERVIFEGCVADPDGNAVRAILTNPGKDEATACLRGRSLRLSGADRLDAEGRTVERLGAAKGVITVAVPARSSVFLRLQTGLA